MKKHLKYLAVAVVNSYAVLFFSQNKILGVLVLLVSFLNFPAGISGLGCVLLAIGIVSATGFPRESILAGLYSFNSLLLGLGFGTFYNFNPAFVVWLAVAGLLTTLLTLILSALLGKYRLPVLSLPFVLVSWLVLTAVTGYPGMGLEQKSSYVMNELFSGDFAGLQQLSGQLGAIQFPSYLTLFFRSLSAILFQDNVLTGLVMAAGLFIHSRIGFSLLVLGFITACLFNQVMGTYPDGISYYHLGANFMMTSCAIGSFFLVPSARSYAWAVISISVTFLLVNGLATVLLVHHLPVFSLPFCLTTLGLLYFFMLRTRSGKLSLTPLQYYSPETNLYQFLNSSERLKELNYLKLHLPFMGTWNVSQGYDGAITHKGDWAKALDFVISDSEGRTYQSAGTRPEHFYCFNKPVLACADGTIEEVVNHIEDNEIGQVNTRQNWGNTIVIKHAEGLYSKLSHLKKGSVKVKAGDYVKQGELLALCGSSGRSPEPHLHFQVQATPYIGSKTLEYPFAYFMEGGDAGATQLHSFGIPAEGASVCALAINPFLKKAFTFQPGYSATVTTENGTSENWEVFTDAYNSSYIYSKDTGATAYFINNGTAFYFTNFYGDRHSLLYSFYLAAFKVLFTSQPGVMAADSYPLSTGAHQPELWVHDLLAPFFQFMKQGFEGSSISAGQETRIVTRAFKQAFGRKKQLMEAEILVTADSIRSLSISLNSKKIKTVWNTETV